MKPAVRGLYVIRSGGAPPKLSAFRADEDPEATAAEEQPDEPEEEDAEVEEAEDPTPDDGRLATLEVAFSRFNTWYEVDSAFEGRFLERTVKGAFKKTLAERGSRLKILFDHGMDPHIGNKVLAVPEVFEERDDSPYIEGGLLDTSYNRDLLPGLRAGAYASSFMFEVLDEDWNDKPDKSEHNPEGLPERTITAVRLYEAGPVTWPANPEATAGVRSGTDWFLDQLARRDARRRDEQIRLLQAFRAANRLGTSRQAATSAGTPTPDAPTLGAATPGRQATGIDKGRRARSLRELAIRQLTRSNP